MQLVVTGMYLCTRFGDTWREIEADGWTIDRSVPMLDQDDDSAVGITRSVARGVEGMGAALADLRPDLLLILGDRFEILCAAQAALFARIPVAHLCGGM
jgi:UDP-N-acetylglucosamine 2-epimerase